MKVPKFIKLLSCQKDKIIEQVYKFNIRTSVKCCTVIIARACVENIAYAMKVLSQNSIVIICRVYGLLVIFVGTLLHAETCCWERMLCPQYWILWGKGVGKEHHWYVADVILTDFFFGSVDKGFWSQRIPQQMRNAAWALSNFCRGKPKPDFALVSPALPVLVSSDLTKYSLYFKALNSNFQIQIIDQSSWTPRSRGCSWYVVGTILSKVKNHVVA